MFAKKLVYRLVETMQDARCKRFHFSFFLNKNNKREKSKNRVK